MTKRASVPEQLEFIVLVIRGGTYQRENWYTVRSRVDLSSATDAALFSLLETSLELVSHDRVTVIGKERYKGTVSIDEHRAA